MWWGCVRLNRGLTIGCTSKLPCASTPPVALFRRQMPGWPEDGGAVEEGTRMRHYQRRECVGNVETSPTYLVEVVKHLRSVLVDDFCKFVGYFFAHTLKFIKRTLLAGY